MLDIALTYNLLKAIAPTAHLLLVGDVDQLPSVGAGNVLRDLINSGAVHTVTPANAVPAGPAEPDRGGGPRG